eukprot:3667714-Amphidinium_carterae.1
MQQGTPTFTALKRRLQDLCLERLDAPMAWLEHAHTWLPRRIVGVSPRKAMSTASVTSCFEPSAPKESASTTTMILFLLRKLSRRLQTSGRGMTTASVSSTARMGHSASAHACTTTSGSGLPSMKS